MTEQPQGGALSEEWKKWAPPNTLRCAKCGSVYHREESSAQTSFKFCSQKCQDRYVQQQADAFGRIKETERRGNLYAEPGDDDAPDRLFAEDVENAAHKLRIREAAHALVQAEKTAALDVPPFDAGTLAEILARPAEPPNRVDELIPSEAGTLVVAMRKTGKTTLLLNLARSLILGEDFLGRFGVRAISGNVALLNYEVAAGQIARWADEATIPRDRLYIVNLRGRRNPLADEGDREKLAALLREHECEALLTDPFGRAFTGKSQNDAGEVGGWLADLDRFARGEVGASDLILSAHAGWEGERSRGASALEDWADSIVTLTRRKASEGEDEDHHRYLRAEGRDVEVDEDRLSFDPQTRLLTLTGEGSRRKAGAVSKAEAFIPAVVAYVNEHPTCGQNALEREIEGSNPAIRAAAKLAAERGLITRTTIGQKVSHMPAAPTDPATASNRVQTASGTQHELRPLRTYRTQDAVTAVDAATSNHSGTQFCKTCEQPPNLASPGQDQCESCRRAGRTPPLDPWKGTS